MRGNTAADVTIGALAGAVGVWVLDRVDWFLYNRESAETQARTRAARPYGLDPAHNVARLAAHAMGRRFPGQPNYPAAHPTGLAVHYGIGMAPATLYAAFGGAGERFRPERGLLFGFALWLLQDEAANAALGLSGDPRSYPWQDHARGLAAHLAYGVAVDGAVTLLKRLAGR